MERSRMDKAARSELARKAALARKACRGGRPKSDDVPEGSVKVFGRDLAVLRAYADLRGWSVKQAVNVLCYALIHGAEVKARPQLKPEGWRLLVR